LISFDAAIQETPLQVDTVGSVVGAGVNVDSIWESDPEADVVDPVAVVPEADTPTIVTPIPKADSPAVIVRRVGGIVRIPRATPLNPDGAHYGSSVPIAIADATISSLPMPSAAASPGVSAIPPAPSRPSTQFQHGIRKPKVYTDGIVQNGLLVGSDEPRDHHEESSDDTWNLAMDKEFDALNNQTWHLVP
jgi:hypothetical protein